ncbi:MAG: hypothetical protein J0H52_09305 [Comamonadaceae bacterium]|nr:hypothetical protein [Comamonadaceae bacterium]MBN9367943.1 hypothetical protein [Comamonadaceae bacterium]
MKIKVQDGSSLSGNQLRALISSLPDCFLNSIQKIFIRACHESFMSCRYDVYARYLEVSVPGPPYADPLPTETVVRKLLIAIAVIAERSELPKKLSTSLRHQATEVAKRFMVQNA